jgi:RNA 2',3'-cyclic 3'-phosphodiesterase
MRLFTGIEIPDDIKERLEVLIEHLQPTTNLKWSPVYNLHITTKFIGEWSSLRLDELTSALRGVARTGAIDIEIKGLGWFPNPHNPKVFWAGIHAGKELAALADATESALERLGVARESRPFSPHLTLARIRQPAPLAPLRQAVAKLESTGFGKFTGQQFHLYLSEPGASGSVYTNLQDFPLADA